MKYSRILVVTLAAGAVMFLSAFGGGAPSATHSVTATPAVAAATPTQSTLPTRAAKLLPAAKPATVSQENAKEKALDYLAYTAFSRTGLIKQLRYEGFSKADATYGTDATHANWYKQAALKAADYLDYSSFSRRGLIAQLKYEGFTTAQATYGAKAVGL